MTAREKWQFSLTCPKCDATGEAHFWEEDGWSYANGDQSTHLSFISDNFDPVEYQREYNLVCKRCHVKAKLEEI